MYSTFPYPVSFAAAMINGNYTHQPPKQKPKDPTISELSSLLANLSAHPSLSRLLTLQIPPSPNKSIAINDTNASQPQSDIALDLLLDLFVTHPSDSPYDHLSYLLASLSGTSSAIRSYFLSPQSYDNVTPLSKIFVFTDHPSVIRRRGVASVLKNVCFEISSHPALLCLPSAAASEIDVLPYLLLPLISGSDSYDDDETDNMLPETQLLPPSKQREQDKEILTMLIESLTLLTTTREGRERLRDVQTYAIVRECHKKIEDEQFGEAVDRLVNVLMRGEEGEDETGGWVGGNDDEDGGRVIEEVL